MPPLPVIAGTYRCTLNWLNTAPAHPRNVLHIHFTPSSATDVGEALIDAMVSNVAAFSMMPAISQLESVDVLELDGSAGTINVTGDAASVITSGSGDIVPEAALCVKHATGLAGPRHRGRTFIGPLTEDNIINGLYVPTLATVTNAWNDLTADIKTNLGGVGYFTVASYVHGDQNEVVSNAARVHLATQRRRLLATR